MSPELQKQLTETLASLTATVKDATQWTAGQVTPLIHEKLVFSRITETFVLVLFIGLICSAAYGSLWCAKKHKSNKYENWEFGSIILGLFAFILGIPTCLQLNDVIMVWFAPRLYILNWLVGMIKG